jgi:hypothetical protein
MAEYQTLRRRNPAPAPAPHPLWSWNLGAVLLALLLIGQIVAFEGQGWAQNARIRPWLETLCGAVGCSLAPFRDIKNIRILNRALHSSENGEGLEFRLIFANESPLPQPYPRIELVLNELNGNPVAERVFDPEEYLPSSPNGAPMPLGQPVEVRLFMVKPSRDVGGFAIKFQ